MATVERSAAQPIPQQALPAPPVVKPPKPIFLRSWFAFVVVVALIAAHVYGWRVSQIDPALLAQKTPYMGNILSELIQPDIIAYDRQVLQVSNLQIAGSENPQQNVQPAQASDQVAPMLQKGSNQPQPIPDLNAQTFNIQLTASANTVAPGQTITVSGTGLRPNTSGKLIWQSAGTNASAQGLGVFTTDSNGAFSAQVTVPSDKDRIVNSIDFPNTLAVQQSWTVGSPYLSDTVGLVVERIIETIFLALMGTTFAVIISIPLSFLAARNLMAHGVIGTTVYVIARTVLNVLRSIEVLIMAVIFVAAVGIGPFAGVLALTLHSIASLGKLYSEAIEAIDPGPIEAITATGANRLQVITYAVVPQFIPQFLSFTLYRWDINVRMSTVIGFVGGGGIGFLLIQYISLLQWNQAGTALLAIAIVVIAIDYASSRLRAAVI